VSVAVDARSLLASLAGLLEEAGDRRTLVSVTAPVEIADPTAAAFAARLASDRWFCWEEPERGFALAAVGSALDVIARGPNRFRDVIDACAKAARERRFAEPPGLGPGAGTVWVGGFAFSPQGGGDSQWSSFPPALMTLPEIAIHREKDSAHLTVAAFSGARPPEEALRGIAARLGALEGATLPLADPHPTGEPRISSVLPPEHFEEVVERATGLIAGGELEKIVLAREVLVEAGRAHDPAAIYGVLRQVFPACFCFCCGSPEGAFLGASPELLVRRNGAGAATVALAGSTRRSSDPAVDDHLGEQLLRSAKDREEHRIVVRRIERGLRPHSVWVEAAPEPGIVRVANIQHLATPVRAQLADPRSAIELAGLLHPTPAVGGEPRDAALPRIRELEGFDRGWYAGPVGWMDLAEDGEFCVAIRSALLRDRTAHLFAGNGIVADSDPAAELAETELKLGALLPLLAG
jgi:salicylate biosynthesis isochorismate synthase